MFRSLMDRVVRAIGSVSWKVRHTISDENKATISKMMVTDYYIILTRRDNHLSTYAENFAHLFINGRWGYYSHALMNLEGDDITTNADFRIVEATGTGVHYSTFDEVFDGVSAVVLLKPRYMTIEDWTAALDKAKTNLGKPYDTLLELYNDSALNCSELVHNALRSVPGYAERFYNFEKMIRTNPTKNLDPQLFYECKDFDVAYEVRT